MRAGSRAQHGGVDANGDIVDVLRRGVAGKLGKRRLYAALRSESPNNLDEHLARITAELVLAEAARA